jgi:hypothetical protein
LEKFGLLVNFSNPNPLHARSGMEVDLADFKLDGCMDPVRGQYRPRRSFWWTKL